MGQTTINVSNSKRPAPKWFRKLKKAILILVVAANAMVPSFGFTDTLLVTRIQLWCTIGIGAILEAFETLLANGEDYTSTEKQTDEKISQS